MLSCINSCSKNFNLVYTFICKHLLRLDLKRKLKPFFTRDFCAFLVSAPKIRQGHMDATEKVKIFEKSPLF